MMSIVLVLQFLFAHWLADFVCRSHWMATNKSKSWWALSLHVATYTLVLGVTLVFSSLVAFQFWPEPGHLIFIVAPQLFLMWLLLNGVLHWITDAITSRLTSRLWGKGDFHNFFVVVGLDQLIHYATLLLTFVWIVSSLSW